MVNIVKFDKTYRDICNQNNFGDRLAMLQLVGFVYMNPNRDVSNLFYKSEAWLQTREQIIIRDLGCDLGINGLYITGPIIVHHIDPLVESDFEEWNEDKLLNPNNLICCSIETHNRIHYGSKKQLEIIERKPGDTKLW